MPLTKAEAKKLTERIELRLGTIADYAEAVVGMIIEAQDGRADLALGFASWVEYVDASFGHQLKRLTRDDRQPITVLLGQAGMSTRLVAELVGVNHSTIVRDQQVVHDAPPDEPDQPELPGLEPPSRLRVIGRDGKNYPRHQGKPTAEEARDIGEAVPKIKRPKQLTYGAKYLRALDNLDAAVGRVVQLHQDYRLKQFHHPDNTGTRLRKLARHLDNLANQHQQHGGPP